MGDVNDILGVTKAEKRDIGAPDMKMKKTKKEKPAVKGFKKGARKGGAGRRELAALADNWDNSMTAVPVIEEVVKPKYAAKRETNVHWKLVPIKSSARCQLIGKPVDDVKLMHWIKVAVPDYRFAKFNKKIKLLTYTQEEYEHYLQHPDWTKEETDRLMSLCSTFDLRFVVVHDQFTRPPATAAPSITFSTTPFTFTAPFTATTSSSSSSSAAAASSSTALTIVPSSSSSSSSSGVKREPGIKDEDDRHGDFKPFNLAGGGSEKTVEDLKARFYSIQQQLLKTRNASDPELKKHPLFKSTFDAAYEADRKEQLARLFRRSHTEVTDMAQLVLENRKISTAIKKVKKQTVSRRGGARRSNDDEGHGATVIDDDLGDEVSLSRAASSATPANMKKRKTRFAGTPTPMMGAGGSSSTMTPMAPIPDHCICREVVKERAPGVFLRSTHLAAPLNSSAQRYSKQLESELTNVGLKKITPITVPTGVACQLYDRLRADIVTMLNLQRHVQKKEQEREQMAAMGIKKRRADGS